MSWLSQKAGINLDDAHEVLNGSDKSYNPQSTEVNDQNNESSKENNHHHHHHHQHQQHHHTPHFGTPKKSRRSTRWTPLSSGHTPPSPPITSIMVPNGPPSG